MTVTGVQTLSAALSQDGYFVKFIASGSAAHFFLGSIQHRDAKMPGLSYEDDYQGNAVAGTISNGIIDVRYHEQYPPERISQVMGAIVGHPHVGGVLDDLRIRYQGRPVIAQDSSH